MSVKKVFSLTNNIPQGILGASRPRLFVAFVGVFLISAWGTAGAQTVPGHLSEFKEEAPEAIFEAQIGDADVDLFVAGSWTTGIGGTLGAAFHPPLDVGGARVSFPYTYPGFEPTPFFNTVDLTISIWLQNRYFFEAGFLDDFAFNTFAVGYRGRDEEFVQSLILGNAPLPFGSYPYLSIGSSETPVPGIAARFRTVKSEHEVLVRLEPTVQHEERFLGTSSVQTSRVEPADYQRGRFFVLPDPGITGLRIFIEAEEDGFPGYRPDGSADGRLYREVSPSEAAVFSRAAGTVYLRQPARSRVLVYYEKGGLTVGDPALGSQSVYAVTLPSAADTVSVGDGIVDEGSLLDFSFNGHGDPPNPPYPAAASEFSRYNGDLGADLADFKVTVDGVDALLLYEPGSYSPFEILGRYAAGEHSEARLVYRNSTTEKTTGVSLELDRDSSIVTAGDQSESVRHYANRYPFIEDFPSLYGPGAVAKEGYTDFVIAFQSLTSSGSLSLGANVVPGTVVITRNGTVVDYFSVNYASGGLTFPFEVSEDDDIRVSYRQYVSEGEEGDLVFGLGNSLRFSDRFTGNLALGLRWNLLGGDYSSSPGQHPGEAVASAEVRYEGEELTASVAAGVAATVVDTTGYYRAEGMEAVAEDVSVSTDTIYPAASPLEPTQIDGTDAPVNDPTLRGKLLYKDFSSVDALGNRDLEPYDTVSLPPGRVYDYVDGSFVGPYVAGGDEEVPGPVVVMDYELEENDVWVGSHLRLSSLDSAVRERAEEFRFSYKALGVSVPVRLVVQFGLIGEDLDGDGELDAGAEGLYPGFEFDDGAITLYTPFASRTGSPAQTEDADGDGLLDRPSQVFTHVVPSAVSGDSGWIEVSIPIEGYRRQLFAGSQAVRVLVVRDGPTGTATTGRVLIGRPEVGAARAYATVESGDGSPPQGSVVAEETFVGVTGLEERFPEVSRVLHANSDRPEVLSVGWSDVDSNSSVVLREYVDPAGVDDYGGFGFYLNFLHSNNSNAETALSLSDAIGAGDEVPIPITPDGVWHKVTVDLDTGAVSVDDEPAPEALDLTSLLPIREVGLRISGADGGRVLVDELHFFDPIPGLGAGGRLALSYTAAKPTLTVSGTDVLSDVTVDQLFFVRTPRFAPVGTAELGPGVFRTSTSVSAAVLGAPVFADLDLTGGAGLFEGAVSHRLAVPLAGVATLGDSLSLTLGSAAFRLTHASEASVGFEPWVRSEGEATATVTDGALRQSWSASISSSLPGSVGVGVGGSLTGTAKIDEPLPDGYGDAFVERYSYLVPTDDPSTRGGNIDASLDVDRAPIGLETQADVSYGLRLGASPTQENSARIGLSVPMEALGLRAALSYGRDWRERSAPTAGDGYGHDVRYAWSRIRGSGYLFNSVPFHELFVAPATLLDVGDSEGTNLRYEPSASLEVSRRVGSAPYNLFVPASAAVELSRRVSRDDDAARVSRELVVTWATAAVNLFGTSAGVPRFTFYESEEISTSTLVRYRQFELAGTSTVSATVTGSATFFGEQGSTLSLSNATSLDFATDEPPRYGNQTNASYGFRSELPNLPTQGLTDFFEEGYFEHEESLSGQVSVTADELDSVRVRIGHSSSMVAPGKGTVRAEASIGLGSRIEPQLFEKRRVFLLGFQGKIEAVLQF
jgi:hypothetical protein